MKIADKLKVAVASLAVVAAGVVALPVHAGGYCQDGTTWSSDYATECGVADSNTKTNLMDILKVIINVALGVIAFVAVIMIIFGGVQYTTSAGDAAKVKKAKDTIMYGVVGLVISLLAYAIVNFVLTNIFK